MLREAARVGKAGGQFETGEEDAERQRRASGDDREEEDAWKISRKSGKMFHMEPDDDGGVELAVVHDIEGEVISASLNSDYSPTLQLECTRGEIDSLDEGYGFESPSKKVCHEFKGGW
jgi:hypothetical protein